MSLNKLSPVSAFMLTASLGLMLSGCIATTQDLDPIRSDLSVLEKQFMEVQKDNARSRYGADETTKAVPAINEKLKSTETRLAAIEKRLDSIEESINVIRRDQTTLTPQPMPMTEPEPVTITPEAKDEQVSSPDTSPSGPKAPTPSTEMLEADEMFAQAKGQLASGDLLNAEAGFRRFLDTYPKDRLADDARFSLGEIYFQNKSYEDAIREYEQVMKDYPLADRVPDALYKAGLAYREMGNNEKAREYFTRVMDNYPYSDAAKKAGQLVGG